MALRRRRPAPARPTRAAAADDDDDAPGTPGGEDRAAAPTTPSKMPWPRALQDHMCAPENAPPIEPAPEELVVPAGDGASTARGLLHECFAQRTGRGRR